MSTTAVQKQRAGDDAMQSHFTNSDNETAAAGPHAPPVVVMLGLFTCFDCLVSAVTIESSTTIWLDLITAGGQHTRPLATITAITAERPGIAIEAHYRDWADRPEVRWHLTRETAKLYRTYLDDRLQPAAQQPRPSPKPRNCPEPGGATVVWRQGK